jgi:hypothetical protein
MSTCYGIYYYVDIHHNSAGVKLVYLSMDLDKIKQFIDNNFTYVRMGINNSINMVYNNQRCIGWVSTYEMDQFLPDQGLTCNQPRNAISINAICDNVKEQTVYKLRKLDFNEMSSISETKLYYDLQ